MRTSTRRYVATGAALIGAVIVGAFVGPHLVQGGPAETAAVAPAPAATTRAAVAPRSEISEASTALRDLAALPVSGAYVTGYDRAAFGPAWADTDHNGCDTRNDVLRANLTAVTVKPGTNGCVVLSGTLNDPYTGQTIRFVRGYRTSELVPIDHVVPLGWTWQHGAATWTAARREQFANDLTELQPVDEASNRAKSDSGPADWMPQNRADWCTYDTRWAEILTTYRLSIDTADKTRITRTLTGCL